MKRIDELEKEIREEEKDINNKISKKKEEIEVRNNAESLVYNSEKTLKELGDKISGEEKAKVENEIANVKKALEGTNTENIKQATEKLTTAFYEISEKLYKQASAAQGAANAGADAYTLPSALSFFCARPLGMTIIISAAFPSA